MGGAGAAEGPGNAVGAAPVPPGRCAGAGEENGRTAGPCGAGNPDPEKAGRPGVGKRRSPQDRRGADADAEKATEGTGGHADPEPADTAGGTVSGAGAGVSSAAARLFGHLLADAPVGNGRPYRRFGALLRRHAGQRLPGAVPRPAEQRFLCDPYRFCLPAAGQLYGGAAAAAGAVRQ